MLRNNTAFLVNELIALGGSTTFFLESVKGEPLRVVVQSQEETGEEVERVIRRVVKLYFRSPGAPVLYCISELKVNMLTDRDVVLFPKVPEGCFYVVAQHAGTAAQSKPMSRCID